MRRKFIFFNFLLITALLTPTLVSYLIHARIQNQLNLTIEGSMTPAFMKQTYRIRDVQMEWPERVRVLSGKIKVSFRTLPLLLTGRTRLQVQGEELSVKLLGDWAMIEGVETGIIDSIVADIEVDSEGLRDIHHLDVQSEQFQFQIQPAVR